MSLTERARQTSSNRATPYEHGDARRALTSKAVAATLALLALSAATEWIPGLARWRIFGAPPAHTSEPQTAPTASAAVGEAIVDLATQARPDLAQPEHAGAPPRNAGPIAEDRTDTAPNDASTTSPVPIADASGALEPFFVALSESERKTPHAVTRVVYFGDSVVASDFGTGTLRRLLQKRFGDAGHGFVLVANAWPQYFHNDVHRVADRGFRVSRIVGPRAEDRLYGLGGVSFTATPGLRTRIGTAKEGSFGRGVSRFGVAYAETNGGGDVEVRVDGTLVRTLGTNLPETHAAFAEIDVPDGEHELELLTKRANVRLFGVTLERDVPGVVLDAVGVVGARLRTFDECDPANFSEALAWRKPNLVVFQFGANESGDGFAYPMPEYHRSMKAMIERVHDAVPGAGCLVIGAMDRARKENDRLVTVPIIPHIVAEQRAVAAEIGCAYYPTFDAMGGPGSMARWVRQGLGTGDFTHPTSWGAERLGTWIYTALMARYDARTSRKDQGGVPPSASSVARPSSP